MNDLLTDPLITTRLTDATRPMTLPAVLAALAADAVEGFPALQPHQQHPWYAFLVQLATLTARAEGALPADAAAWRGALERLAGSPTAWQLVVADRTRPAFMQPPVGTAKLGGSESVPDGLDVLLTAKNHDVKRERVRAARPEHWVFALVSLQTMQGFLGRGNYGVARMNGGFGNRPCVGRAPSRRWGARWRRDVAVLLDAHAETAAHFGFATGGGHALLWTVDWSGDASLPLTACDPFVVEICRRVRLERTADGLQAITGPSDGARLAAKALLGLVGDPWTPYQDEKSLTLNGEGFSYRRLVELLFEPGFHEPAALAAHPDDPPEMWICCWALVRGQGQTEGLHQRWLPIPEEIGLMMGEPEGHAALATAAKARVEAVRTVRMRVLRPALMGLLGEGANPKDNQDFLRRHDQRLEAFADQHFFPDLWRDPTDDASWSRALLEEAERILEDAIDSTGLPSARRYRRIAAAQGLFLGCRRKHFADLYPAKGAA